MRYALLSKIVLAPLAILLMPALAAAQDNGNTAVPSAATTDYPTGGLGAAGAHAHKQVWDVVLGVGAAVRPTFEGSDHYRISPVPVVSITYDDLISLGANGLSAFWHHDNFRIGAGLTYGGGRKDSQSSGIFDQGDDRLKGLGDIDSALGVKAFASYKLGRLDLSGSITKFTGHDDGTNHADDGILANMGIGLPFKVGNRFKITPHLGATWANMDYMQPFFGVTPAQAANSRFSQFTAGSGFKDINEGINFNYGLDKHWFAGADVGMKELTGDAAKSPISFANTEASFMTMIGCHF